jgi:endoglucanase
MLRRFSWRRCEARRLLLAVMFSSLLLVAGDPVSCVAKVRFTGTNLAGAEFGVSNGNVNLPGTYGTHYTYPTGLEAQYFLSKGLNTFRVPFRWERLQRSQFAELHGSDGGAIGELDRMDAFVNVATTLGGYVILEPHNFQRYFPATNNFQSSTQGLIGSSVPDTAYADFWGKVADHYKNNPRVIFNLMNEPNTMPTAQLVTSHNAAIQAIRDKGAKNLILVPGNAWTGAHAWNETYYNGANSVHMLNIVDPLDNFAFDVHQYLDNDSSGTSDQIGTNANPNNPIIGVERLTNFTNWLHANGRKGFLGEFAVANSRIGTGGSQIGDEAINNMLNHIEANEGVWLGWAWWAAGPWWGNYMFTLEPSNFGQPTQSDQPALGVLRPFAADELPGDFNFDGMVDAADYTVWRDAVGKVGAGNDADSNIDGRVDELDYAVWKTNFGDSLAGRGSAASVPEPAAMLLLTAGSSAFAALRRRRNANCTWNSERRACLCVNHRASYNSSAVVVDRS